MKRLNILAAIMCLAAFVGCDKENKITGEVKGGEKRLVTINLAGDILKEEYLPLTRADEAKTIYGIEIQSKDQNGYYEKYACGLFDNTGDMKIELETGAEYKFRCHVVEEGEDRLYTTTNSGIVSYLDRPFSGKLENKFKISHLYDYGNYYWNQSYSRVYDNYYAGDKCEPKFRNVYYGEKTDYKVTEDGAVTIDLKAAKRYGVTFKVNPPSDGSVTVSISGKDGASCFTVGSEDEPKEFEFIKILGAYNRGYSYYYDEKELKNSKEYQHFTDFTDKEVYWKETATIEWTRGNGAVRTYTKPIIMKSNTMMVINVDVNGESGESSFSLNIPKEEKLEEVTIDFKIEGGELVTNTIDPVY